MKQFARYLLLIVGFGLAGYVIYVNYEGPDLLLMQIALMFLWALLPVYVYFFLSRKHVNKFIILFPALFILATYITFTYSYFTSDSSTAALAFVVLPVFALAAMGLGYLVAWIIIKATGKE
mgnify:CR=1 FL=1